MKLCVGVGTQIDSHILDFIQHAQSFLSNFQSHDRMHGGGDRQVHYLTEYLKNIKTELTVS